MSEREPGGIIEIEPTGHTRAAFILRGALAVGAAYGAGAVAPFVSQAFASVGQSDLRVIEFALGLEQLEAAFYKTALARAGLTGKAKTLATEFGVHEADHVQALTQLLSQLGGKAPAAARAKFGLTDQASFLKTAVTLEDVGVGAYNGATPLLVSPDLASAFGSIVQIEGRHSSALRMLAGMDPSPQAFDKPITAQQTAAAAAQFTQ
jgi:rubrerythrin